MRPSTAPLVAVAASLAGRSVAVLFLLSLAGCRSTPASLPDPASDPPAVSAGAAHSPAITPRTHVGIDPGHAGAGTPLTPRTGNALAAFAEGCFWGSEDNFRQVPGVVATAAGYSGGHTDDPTYESVCAHTTGHAETVLIEFDPKKVSYEKLLEVFFATHDPTTKDRQGPDIGDQYRSAIFTFSDAQRAAASAAASRAEAAVKKPVTTEIRPIGRFWMAEDYHQQYDEKTGKRSCPLPSGLLEGT